MAISPDRNHKYSSLRIGLLGKAKVSLTAASGLSGFLVSWSGYRSEIRHDLPPDVIDTMRILVVAVPSGVILIALIILMFYPITERVIEENRKKLEAMRGEVK
jgi:Na+/melibiose symporter-like transporter